MVGGNSRPRSKIEWHRLERGVLVSLLAQALLTLATFALGWLDFPLFVLLLVVELVLVSVLTGLRYPARGKRRITDAIKSVAICAFLLLFILPVYLGAAHGNLPFGERVLQLFLWRPQAVAVAFALLFLRIGLLWYRANRSADPRMAWGRDAMRDGAVIVITLFLGAFGSLAGLFLTGPLWFLVGPVAPDLAFGLVLVAIHTGLSCVMATMSEAELREIVGNPYVD